MNTPRARVIAGLSVIGIILSCGGRDGTDGFVRQEMAKLQKRTVPPGSTALSQSGPIQDRLSKTASWEFETSWDWRQYEGWVISQLQHDFVVRRLEGRRLLFVRSLRGDTEELGVEQVPGRFKLKVKVTLAAHPD